MNNDLISLLSDKHWRMNNLYKITDVHGNQIPFIFNKAQRHFFQNRNNRSIILKSRQLGFTTYATIDMLDDTLFNPNFFAMLISYDDDSAKDLFQRKVMYAWEHLHQDIKKLYKVDSSRANLLRVDLGKGNFSGFKVDNTGRSGTYNNVHVSEFGSIAANNPEKVEKIIRGTFPCCHPPHGKITVESTSEGPDNAFYDMFMQAYALPPNHTYRPTEFKAFFYNWQWDQDKINSRAPYPLSQKELNSSELKPFIEIQRKHNEKAHQHPTLYEPITDQQITYFYYLWLDDCNKSWKKLFLEYPITVEDAFKSASRNIFDIQLVEQQLPHTKQILPREFKNWLFYDEIKSNHQYVISADPSEGVSNHHSAATIWDFTPTKPKIIATFQDNTIPPDLFGHELKSMAQMCNMCLIMVERNNDGKTTLDTLKGIYPTDLIYKEYRTNTSEDEQTERLGWLSTLTSKPKIFYNFATAFNDQLIDIPSFAILTEMFRFDRKELQTIKSKDDETTKHFDLLHAAAIGFHGRSELEILSGEPEIIIQTSNNDPFALI